MSVCDSLVVRVWWGRRSEKKTTKMMKRWCMDLVVNEDLGCRDNDNRSRTARRQGKTETAASRIGVGDNCMEALNNRKWKHLYRYQREAFHIDLNAQQ